MDRRQLLIAGLTSPLLVLAGDSVAAQLAAMPGDVEFNAETVATLARALAARPYVAADVALPTALAGLDYDQYRDYRFRAEAALWRGDDAPFQAQFFHRGFLFKERVDVFVVEGGRSRPYGYHRDLFDFGQAPVPPDDPKLGFAGFRLHAPLNRPDYFDELCVFLGASYFRAVARGLQYGLSARGLALGSGDPGPEEFPRFTTFWLEAPAGAGDAVVVHALLDSPSVAAAFRFAITPGDDTVFEVDARLFPRTALANAGIAPLTSMFEFDAGDRAGIDDFRPAVHDSDGLAIHNGRGEVCWRPLRNPAQLSHSGFQDEGVRGYGLMQRKRDFADFADGEARYDKRPACWVEPVGDWGRGEVHLVEIPTADEFHDNIVAFWRPDAPLAAGREHRFRYRLHWCADHDWNPALARVVATRAGRADGNEDARLFVIEFEGGALASQPADAPPPTCLATASAGAVRNAVVYRNPQARGWIASFELVPGTAAVSELRVQLVGEAGPLSETWLARWPS